MSDEVIVDAGQDVAPADDVTTQDGAQVDDAEATTQDATASEPATETSAPDEPVIAENLRRQLAKATEELTKFKTKVLPNLQEENAKLKEQAKPEAPKPKQAGDTHPALQGLKSDTDEDGNKLFFDKGRWWTEDEIVDRYDTRQEIESLKSQLTAKEAAAEAARQQELSNALEESVKSAVSDQRSTLFPDFKGKDASDLDESLLASVNTIVTRELANGAELTDELIVKGITTAMETQRRLFGLGAAAQLKNNQTYKTTHPVTPGAPGSTADPDYFSLSKSERGKIADAAVSALAKGKKPG